MKRLIIPFVAAFAISLGGATGVVMMRAPKAGPPAAPPVAPADSSQRAKEPAKDSTSATADGTAAESRDSAGKADSGRVAEVAAGAKTATPEKEHSSTGATLQATAKGTPVAAINGGAHAPARKTEVPAVTPVTDSLISHRLAQVFAAMQAKDAARVLEQMNDNDVRAILGSLSSKQQAAILGNFPTARAASILQTTLRTASNGGTE